MFESVESLACESREVNSLSGDSTKAEYLDILPFGEDESDKWLAEIRRRLFRAQLVIAAETNFPLRPAWQRDFKRTRKTQIAGMWLEDLLNGIGWCCSTLNRRRQHGRAPSWSWPAHGNAVL